MHLFLHNYKASPNLAMKLAGYTRRDAKADWIREDKPNGRFHFKKVGDRVLHLHFDIFLDDHRHYAPRMPVKLAAEMKRVRKKLYPLQTRKLTEREYLKLVEKYT